MQKLSNFVGFVVGSLPTRFLAPYLGSSFEAKVV